MEPEFWKRYAAAAIAEIREAALGLPADAPAHLAAAWEHLERAMESIEEEKEHRNGDR